MKSIIEYEYCSTGTSRCDGCGENHRFLYGESEDSDCYCARCWIQNNYNVELIYQ